MKTLWELIKFRVESVSEKNFSKIFPISVAEKRFLKTLRVLLRRVDGVCDGTVVGHAPQIFRFQNALIFIDPAFYVWRERSERIFSRWESCKFLRKFVDFCLMLELHLNFELASTQLCVERPKLGESPRGQKNGKKTFSTMSCRMMNMGRKKKGSSLSLVTEVFTIVSSLVAWCKFNQFSDLLNFKWILLSNFASGWVWESANEKSSSVAFFCVLFAVFFHRRGSGTFYSDILRNSFEKNSPLCPSPSFQLMEFRDKALKRRRRMIPERAFAVLQERIWIIFASKNDKSRDRR